MDRKRTCFLQNRDSKRRGNVSLLLILTFLPIIAVWIFVLGLRSRAIQDLVEQRRLDRCLYAALESRCSILSKLSVSNRVLKMARKGKVLIKVIEVILPELEIAEDLASMPLRAVEFYQEGLRVEESLSFAQSAACAMPTEPFQNQLSFSRDSQFGKADVPESAIPVGGFPDPLVWDNRDRSGGIQLRSWDLRKESYGFCRASGGRAGELNGEAYQVDFHPPPGKFSSKPSLFSRLFR